MGRIGAYRYPDITLEEAMLILRVILECRGDKAVEEIVVNKRDLARKLGHVNERSGAFKAKMQSLKLWGLVDRGGRVTELGMILASTVDETELTLAALKALKNVALFRHLLEEMRETKPSFEAFKIALQKVTRADVEVIKRKSEITG